MFRWFFRIILLCFFILLCRIRIIEQNCYLVFDSSIEILFTIRVQNVFYILLLADFFLNPLAILQVGQIHFVQNEQMWPDEKRFFKSSISSRKWNLPVIRKTMGLYFLCNYGNRPTGQPMIGYNKFFYYKVFEEIYPGSFVNYHTVIYHALEGL